MIKKGINLTKCCGVAYNISDIDRVVDFSLKKGLRYYYIKHIGKNDEIEDDNHKVHWHFIIESDSQHRFIINALLTDTFKENLFQKCDNVHSYLRYMLHVDYLDKEHYKISDIVSNVEFALVESYVNDIVIDKKELDKENFNIILDMILTKELCSFGAIIKYCRLNNIEYKTSWTITFIQLLKERR